MREWILGSARGGGPGREPKRGGCLLARPLVADAVHRRERRRRVLRSFKKSNRGALHLIARTSSSPDWLDVLSRYPKAGLVRDRA